MRWPRASEPDDLGRFFVERANAGDVDGLVQLYEPEAVLAASDGEPAVGHAAIRRVYRDLLSGPQRPTFTPGRAHPALRHGDLALTSTRLVGGGATAEVARRQPDGSWLWVLGRVTKFV